MIEETESIIKKAPGMAKIEAILSGPDYFYCEKGHARIKKEECIRRQEGVTWHKGQYGTFQDVAPECQDCEQGKQIIENSKGEEMQGKVCKIEGCEKPVDSQGLCAIHYQAWLYDPDRELEPGEPVCSVEGCHRRVKANGLCKTHYAASIKKDAEHRKSEKPARRKCSVEGCEETEIKVRGMCARHYNIWYNKEKRKHDGKRLSERGLGYGEMVPEAEPEEGEIPTAGGPRELSLDFSEMPEMLEELEALAKEELRPLNMQALYLIKNGLRNLGIQRLKDGEE